MACDGTMGACYGVTKTTKHSTTCALLIFLTRASARIRSPHDDDNRLRWLRTRRRYVADEALVKYMT